MPKFNFPIFQPIMMILVSKFMVSRALFDKTYLYLGLLSPLMKIVIAFNSKLYGLGMSIYKIDTVGVAKPAWSVGYWVNFSSFTACYNTN